MFLPILISSIWGFKYIVEVERLSALHSLYVCVQVRSRGENKLNKLYYLYNHESIFVPVT